MDKQPTVAALTRIEAAWRASSFGAAAIGNTTIIPDLTGTGDNTRVQIDHVIPDLLTGSGSPARWRVTTTPQFLSRHRFHSQTIARIRQADQPATKGRVVYCVPASSHGNVTAAISYHLPRRQSHPLQVTAIAVMHAGSDAQVAESYCDGLDHQAVRARHRGKAWA